MLYAGKIFTVVFNSYYFMCVDILCKCMSVHHIHVCNAKGGQVRVSDVLALDLQRLFNSAVGAGN